MGWLPPVCTLSDSLLKILLAIADSVSLVLIFFHIFAQEKTLLGQSCRPDRLVHTSTVHHV